MYTYTLYNDRQAENARKCWAMEENRIVEFFANKTILVTGASGFLGKVLVEKLLRSCGFLDKIYVIIREKKGKSAKERLQEILNGPLYDRLKKECGEEIIKKVEAIPGDVTALDLGLSSEDRQKLLEETEIVYHSAATVRFDDPLKDTILLNVRGTKLMLELAKECKKLKVFCYVSTAYCNEDQKVLAEKFYPSMFDPNNMIQLCEWLNKDTLDRISKELRGPSHNNYTLSKALGEALIEEHKDSLPVIIQRPSIVTPVWREPLAGWTDNLNGPAGLLVGAGKGVIRTMYAKEDLLLDAVPVDIIANGLIITTYDFCRHRTRRIYNLSASEENKHVELTAKKLIDYGKIVVNERVAFSQVLWYPNGSATQSRLLHTIKFITLQLLPAVLIDAILYIIGIKPFLCKVQRRVWNGYKVFEYYTNREWNFRNDNLQAARSLLNSNETKMFKYDAEGMDVYEYFVDCTRCCRRYMMKEDDSSIPAALRKMKMLWFLDLVCKSLLVIGLLYYGFKKIF